MKYLFYLIILLILHVSGEAQDSLDNYLQTTFPAFQLKSDLHFIRQKVEFKKYNASGFYFIGKKRFNFLYDSISQVIEHEKEMTLKDFYLLTSRLIQELQDDRAVYSMVGDQLKKENRLRQMKDAIRIPIYSVVMNDTAYILNSKLLPDHAQLVSIDGIPATEIIKNTFKDVYQDNWHYLNNNGFGAFPFYLRYIYIYVKYGFRETITVTYIPHGKSLPEKQEIKLYKPIDTSLSKAFIYPDRKNKSLELRFEEDMAILKVNGHTPFEINIDTINAIFSTIKEKNSQTLIIDIANCTLSYDYFWLTLLNYFHEGEISLYGYQKEPVDLNKYTVKHLRNKDYVKGKVSKIADDCRFNGDIYLVMGYGTRSSAVTFADIMTYNRLATATFGQETGDKASRYDHPLHYYLPVTGLSLYLSSMLVKSLDQTKHTRGIIPDYQINLENIKTYHENKEQHNALILQKVIQKIKKLDPS
ncbi:MAG: hypothetical protein KQI35_08910 [Bacteroidetes bacterium]|nr:hypothetical protein [Bacteroidota bacterium]